MHEPEAMNTSVAELAERAELRKNLFHVLAACFRQPPSQQFLQLLKESPIGEFNVDPNWNLEEIKIEFHGLFFVPAGHYTFPFESCYRGRKENGRPGRLMGPWALQVLEEYRRAGVQVAPQTEELPDNVAVEFAFLEELALRELEALQRGDSAEAQSYRNWQRNFFKEHILTWVPDLCAEIQLSTSHPYFVQLADWVRTLLGVIAEDLELEAILEVPAPGFKRRG